VAKKKGGKRFPRGSKVRSWRNGGKRPKRCEASWVTKKKVKGEASGEKGEVSIPWGETTVSSKGRREKKKKKKRKKKKKKKEELTSKNRKMLTFGGKEKPL